MTSEKVASLVAQLVKNRPAMRETWVPSLGWEGPLEKGKAIHSSILAWRIPWTVTVHGVAKSDMTERLSLSSEKVSLFLTVFLKYCCAAYIYNLPTQMLLGHRV